MKKTKANKQYWPENYRPNKNSVPVVYNGVTYLSKAQCMALEGITRKELEAYLTESKEIVVEVELEEVTEEVAE